MTEAPHVTVDPFAVTIRRVELTLERTREVRDLGASAVDVGQVPAGTFSARLTDLVETGDHIDQESRSAVTEPQLA